MKPNPTQAALEAAAEERAVAHLMEVTETRDRIAPLALRRLERALHICRIGY